MQDFQKPLVEAWTDYVAGRLDAKALKGPSLHRLVFAA